VRKTWGFGIAAVLPVTMTVALLTPNRVTSPPRDLDRCAISEDDSASEAIEADQTDDNDADDGDIDLFGNEVTPAVATYRLDPAGSPYEVHSPRTEVPRLASPKS